MSNNNNTPKVYILILNYCSYEDTILCVKAVKNSTYINYKILVIDNDSPNNEGTILKQKLSKDEFLQLPKNIGYAGGNNVGIQLAMKEGADYILILNPDTRLASTSISEYTELLESDKSIGALNPIQVCEDGYTIDEKFRRSTFDAIDLPVPDLTVNNAEQWEVPTLFGAALMLPVATIYKVGGFDPLYFAYSEEEDLCRRIKFHGLRLILTGKSPVRHLRTKEVNGASDFVLFLRLKGSYLFRLKDPNRSFLRSVKIVTKDICEALLGRRNNESPFNLYSIRKYHIIKSAIWLCLHILSIYRHKKLDSLGRSHV